MATLMTNEFGKWKGVTIDKTDHILIPPLRLPTTFSFLRRYEIGRFLSPQIKSSSLENYSIDDLVNTPTRFLHKKLLAPLANKISRKEYPQKAGNSFWILIDPEKDLVRGSGFDLSNNAQSYPKSTTPATLSSPSPCIWYGGKIVIRENSEFELCLNPPRMGPSCRFLRKYGSDRFLRFKLPRKDKKEEENGNDIKTPEEGIFAFSHKCEDPWDKHWLSPTGGRIVDQKFAAFLQHPLMLDGRKFFCFREDDETLFFFATEGPGLETVTLMQFLNDHIPLDLNRGMALAKVNARLALGLSKTTPTFTFEPKQVIDWKDIESPLGGVVMTDGAGLISPAAMRRVAELGGWDLKHGYPSTVQARLNGNKGTWTVAHDAMTPPSSDEIWIIYRESQHKYARNPNEPCILEVNRFSRANLESTMLGEQMLRVLDDRMMDFFIHNIVENKPDLQLDDERVQAQAREKVNQILEELAGRQGKQVEEWMLLLHIADDKDRVILRRSLEVATSIFQTRLREALQGWDPCSSSGFRTFTQELNERYTDLDSASVFEGSDDGEEGLDLDDEPNTSSFGSNESSGYPSSDEEAALRMLDAGFDPLTNFYLASLHAKILQKCLKKLEKDARLKLDCAANVFCIPDPSGTLREGEIFVQFTGTALHSDGSRFQILQDKDVIVTRSPCVLPSDAQRVRAVYKSELAKYFDVAIFSVKGETPLAGKLGGGDYDGDIVSVIWEPLIVESFRGVEVQPMEWSDEEMFDTEKGNIESRIIPLRNLSNVETQTRELQKLLLRPLFRSRYFGEYAKFQKEQARKYSSSHRNAIRASWVYAATLDSAKQGKSLRDDFHLDRKKDFKAIQNVPEHSNAEAAVLAVGQRVMAKFQETLISIHVRRGFPYYHLEIAEVWSDMYHRSREVFQTISGEIKVIFSDYAKKRSQYYTPGQRLGWNTYIKGVEEKAAKKFERVASVLASELEEPLATYQAFCILASYAYELSYQGLTKCLGNTSAETFWEQYLFSPKLKLEKEKKIKGRGTIDLAWKIAFNHLLFLRDPFANRIPVREGVYNAIGTHRRTVAAFEAAKFGDEDIM